MRYQAGRGGGRGGRGEKTESREKSSKLGTGQGDSNSNVGKSPASKRFLSLSF